MGIIVHVAVGSEKRTEFFDEQHFRIGSDETNELQIHTSKLKEKGVWLEFEMEESVYRIVNFSEILDLKLNGFELHRHASISNGDVISIESEDISFSFFTLASESSLIITNRNPHVDPLVKESAIDTSELEKHDDAKAFLQEFSLKIPREISRSSKLIALMIFVGTLSGLFYLGYGFYKKSKEAASKSRLRMRL